MLIAPNLVLTAQHCVSAATGDRRIKCAESKFTEQVPPDTVTVTTESTIEDTGKAYAVSNVIVPTERELCGADIALLVLDSNVPDSEATPATPQVKTPMSERNVVGKEIAAIGYGQTSASKKDAGTRHIKTDIPIRCIPGDKKRDCKSWDVPSTREFRTRGAVCDGDSGSGAFDPTRLDGKTPVTFGVLSRYITNGDDCLDAIYTRTDMYAKLIVSTAIVAAQQGGYDPPAWTEPDSGEEPPPIDEEPPTEDVPPPSDEGEERGQEQGEPQETGSGFDWPSVDDVLGWLDKWLPKLAGASQGKNRPPSADEPGAPGLPESTKPPVPAGGERSTPPAPDDPYPSSSDDEDRADDDADDDDEDFAKDKKPKPKASSNSGCAMAYGSSTSSTAGILALSLAAALVAARRRRSS